jgi:N-acetylmuramoyl-L-alanine amidase
MRDIKWIVIHCAATKEGKDFDVEDIRRWHKNQGWSDVGYHYVIKLDGTIQKGREDSVIGAGVRGYNKNSIHICLIGGLDSNGNPKNTFTDAQLNAARQLAKELQEKYTGKYNPAVVGHRDFPGVAKACPCFDVGPWFYTPIIEDEPDEDSDIENESNLSPLTLMENY